MKVSGWSAVWLSPLALSNTALVWATIIGGFSTLILVPGTSSLQAVTWSWAAVVVASQAAFALVILGVRAASPSAGPWRVLITLAVGGAVRGIVIAIGAGITGVAAYSTSALVGRSLNSAVISVVGVSLIGATLTWRADFQAQYRLLRHRALLIGSAVHESSRIDPAVLVAWTSMKGDLDTTLQATGQRLAVGASPHDMRQAADLLTAAIDGGLRPKAHAMWQEASAPEQPLKAHQLLLHTIGRWRLPLREILAFLAVTVGVGSIVRSGLLAGSAYTLRYIAVTGLILWISTSIAAARPRFAPVIAVITLLLLPPVILLSDYAVGDELLGLPEDSTGQIIVALQTPITTIFIAMAAAAVRDRQQVLTDLQARIDAEVAFAQSRDRGGRDAQRLSLYVHHSVQSELAALALQVREAAETADPATIDEVRRHALERLARLEAIDRHSPPWDRRDEGRHRIAEVIEAWSGILQIDADLPDPSGWRTDQWHVAAQVIEEGVANAARHGGADRVVIEVHRDGGALALRICDNGRGTGRTGHPDPGLGMQWLDRVAPGDWSFAQTDGGAELTVVIR